MSTSRMAATWTNLRRTTLGTTIFLLIVCRYYPDQTYAQGGLNSTVSNPYLFLIRDPVVHDHLKVTQEQKQAILRVTDQLDQPLLAVRGQTVQDGTRNLQSLIDQAKAKMKQILTRSQQQRLAQIQLRVRGIRSVLADEVADKLQLTGDQRDETQSIVDQTDQALQTLQQKAKNGADQSSLNKEILRVREEEQHKVVAILDNDQKKRLVALLGPNIDTSKIGKTLSFKAPELSPSDVWINSAPLTLSALRGKVVALHFWAFG